MGIHTKRCAGNQSAMICTLGNSQVCGVIRKNGFDLINLIGHSFTQDIQVEHIANFHLVQVREHFLGCHARVGSQNSMGILTANRQRATQQMTNASLQSGFICSMVDGQSHLDLGDLHISHNAVSCNIELVLIIFGGPEERFIVKRIYIFDAFQDSLVILLGKVSCLIQSCGIYLLHLLLVSCVDFRLMLFVIARTDDGIKGND